MAQSASSDQLVSLLMKQVAGLSAVNREIIDRIEKKGAIQRYHYKLVPEVESAHADPNGNASQSSDTRQRFFNGRPAASQPLQLRLNGDPAIRVEERIDQIRAAPIVDEFRPEIQLEPVQDLFRDKLDYTCNSFKDIARINNAIPKIVHQFSVLLPDIALPLGRQYLKNLELLQVALGKLEGKLRALEQTSCLKELQEQMGLVCAALSSIGKQVEAANKHPSHSYPPCAHTPTLVDQQAHVVFRNTHAFFAQHTNAKARYFF